jgi:hypothetical protein
MVHVAHGRRKVPVPHPFLYVAEAVHAATALLARTSGNNPVT